MYPPTTPASAVAATPAAHSTVTLADTLQQSAGNIQLCRSPRVVRPPFRQLYWLFSKPHSATLRGKYWAGSRALTGPRLFPGPLVRPPTKPVLNRHGGGVERRVKLLNPKQEYENYTKTQYSIACLFKIAERFIATLIGVTSGFLLTAGKRS